MFSRRCWVATLLLSCSVGASAQATTRVVDVPTRPGVTQRLLVIAPPAPRAAVLLFAGGHGGLQLSAQGTAAWGNGNFLVRSRQLFAEQGLAVAVVDAPSDRQAAPFLGGFRQTPEHAADVRAAIAWLRASAKVPVWLIGTSRGTQSVAYVATELADAGGPDGIVLTATVLRDKNSRAVPEMPVSRLRIPVLVVHHANDGCKACPFFEARTLIGRLSNAPRKQLLAFTGGLDAGDPCEAFAHHGFNGLERDVVQQIAAWMLAK